MNKVGVIGAGAWGTALAIAASRAGSNVTLWSHNQNVADDVNNNHRNIKYLGKTLLDKKITATCNLADAFGCEIVLLAVPAQSLRGVVKMLMDKGYNGSTPLIICCKGVEQGSHALMSDIVAEYFTDNKVAILSGPNFADEVAEGLPACATIACKDKAAAGKIIALLGSERLRLYYSDDVMGAQIGGAVKNVIAIACGIAIGRGLGENARAALVTRGIAEIGRLCIKLGGRQETLLGLSGIGDIMLTCGSAKSRNMHFGVELGKGRAAKEILASSKTVEGVVTAKSVAELAKNLGVEMPITNAVKAIIHDHADIDETIKTLLDRPFGVECDLLP